MRLLAIDTALPSLSVCLMESGAIEPLVQESLAMERGHAEALMPLVERVMASTTGGFAALEKVAVTVGPGSFTGIRVGVAAGRAIALARAIPVVGVSTLAAFAAPLIVAGESRPIVAAIDARHGALYVQGFAPSGHSNFGPRCLATKDYAAMLGPEPVRVTGNGAPALALELWARGIEAEVMGELIAPDILFVARLGLLARPATAPPRPLYLKAPDAKRPAA